MSGVHHGRYLLVQGSSVVHAAALPPLKIGGGGPSSGGGSRPLNYLYCAGIELFGQLD